MKKREETQRRQIFNIKPLEFNQIFKKERLSNILVRAILLWTQNGNFHANSEWISFSVDKIDFFWIFYDIQSCQSIWPPVGSNPFGLLQTVSPWKKFRERIWYYKSNKANSNTIQFKRKYRNQVCVYLQNRQILLGFLILTVCLLSSFLQLRLSIFPFHIVVL